MEFTSYPLPASVFIHVQIYGFFITAGVPPVKLEPIPPMTSQIYSKDYRLISNRPFRLNASFRCGEDIGEGQVVGEMTLKIGRQPIQSGMSGGNPMSSQPAILHVTELIQPGRNVEWIKQADLADGF